MKTHSIISALLLAGVLFCILSNRIYISTLESRIEALEEWKERPIWDIKTKWPLEDISIWDRAYDFSEEASQKKLMSLEEWEQSRDYITITETKNGIACPKCGAELYSDLTRVLTSNPAQIPIYCKKCGWNGTKTE